MGIITVRGCCSFIYQWLDDAGARTCQVFVSRRQCRACIAAVVTDELLRAHPVKWTVDEPVGTPA